MPYNSSRSDELNVTTVTSEPVTDQTSKDAIGLTGGNGKQLSGIWRSYLGYTSPRSMAERRKFLAVGKAPERNGLEIKRKRFEQHGRTSVNARGNDPRLLRNYLGCGRVADPDAQLTAGTTILKQMAPTFLRIT